MYWVFRSDARAPDVPGVVCNTGVDGGNRGSLTRRRDRALDHYRRAAEPGNRSVNPVLDGGAGTMSA